MTCLNLAACVSPGASLVGGEGVTGVARYAESERAQRFAELLQMDPTSSNIYSPASDFVGSEGNVTGTMMSAIQNLDLPDATLQAALQAAQAADSGFNELVPFLVQFQMDMLRSHMMFEVVATAKQGVTTLFQQQG